MGKRQVARDPIPEHFGSLEEAADFWDRHDLADYDDLTADAQVEVALERRTFLAALEPELARKLAEVARRDGVSTETLINVWLAEKLLATTAR